MSGRRLEDVYPLSPVQQGMLFETVAAPGSGTYVQQFVYRLSGDVDPGRLRDAWQRVVNRHPILRTAFAWEKRREPLQAVLRSVTVPWRERDISGLDPDDQRASVDRYLTGVAREGFTLTGAPQLRLALWRCGPTEYLLGCSYHHLIMDAWSRLAVVDEVLATYTAGSEVTLEPAPGYGEYVRWIKRQDQAAADAYWRGTLAGFDRPTPLPGGGTPQPGAVPDGKPGRRYLHLEPDAVTALREYARGRRLTLNTVLQGAWALVLAGTTGADDLVFGTTVSGRPAELPGAEQIVGPFINTLPVRVRIEDSAALGGWLADLQQHLLELRGYEHLPLAQLRALTAVPRGVPLFESVVDVQAFGTSERTEPDGAGLTVELLDGRERTMIPLAFAATVHDDDLWLRLDHDPSRLTDDAMQEVEQRLAEVLGALPGAGDDTPLVDLLPAGWPESVRPVPAARPASPPAAAGAQHATPAGELPDELMARLVKAPADRRNRFLRALRQRMDESGPVRGETGPVRGETGPVRRGAGPVRAEAEFVAWRRGLDLESVPVAVTDEVRAKLLDWADGGTAGYPDGALATVIEARADADPDAPAVRFAGNDLSYAELDERANRLAHVLRERGVGREALVGVCLERGFDLIVALLAILKAGGAYLPLDPAYPAGRLATILTDARPELVLSQQRLTGRFDAQVPLLLVDTDSETIASAPADRPAPVATAQDLAYVLYTSGSTGVPKGVAVEQRSVVNFAEQIGIAYDLHPGTRLLALAPLTFDVSVFDIFAGLVRGATLVLADEQDRLSVDRLQRLLAEEKVQVAEIPPALMPLLHPDDLPDLALVSVGGEAPSGALVEPWTRGGRRLVNGYGPTETTVAVSLYECTGRWDTTPPIGRPMTNHRAYVLDAQLELVPVGTPGELCISGVGVARGYYGRPELTAERFPVDPYHPSPGARLYRTGDRVRWLPDGNLEFLGRIDRQVKLRGFRVELGEVERVLGAHPAVDAAVVDVLERDGTKHLIGWVTGASVPDAADLRAYLGERLPDYMVPSRIVALDAMPRTVAGKVDRSALPAPDLSASPLGPAVTAPQGATQARIATEILAPLLGLEQVGADDDFFELGGNSLQATQVTSRVRDAFGVEIGLVDFFATPTVAGLADLVDAARDTGSAQRRALLAALDQAVGEAAAEPAPASGVAEELPLSYPQLRVWRAEQAEPGTAIYNAPLALRLEGDLDPEAVRTAFTELTRRHEPLRARFVSRNGQPVQIIEPEPAIDFTVVDLRDRPEAEREAEARRLVGAETARPFDLENGPMLRVQLVRLDEQTTVLQWVIHHIVTDAWSLGVQLREFGALYSAAVENRPPDLDPLPARYAEFVHAQHEFLAGDAGQRDKDWWTDRLAGAPARLALPYDRAGSRGSTEPSFRPGYHNVRLPDEVSVGVKALGRRTGGTLYMTLLAGYAALLGYRTGATELLVATPIAGRTRSSWESLVGFFVNRIVVRVDLSGDPTFAELLTRVRASATQAFAHQQLPFEVLLDELRDRLGGKAPAVRVMFSLQNTPQAGGAIAGVHGATPMPDDSGRDFTPVMELYSPLAERFDLSLVLRERSETLVAGGLEYNAQRFGPDTVAGLDEQFSAVLAAAVADPDRRLSDLRTALADDLAYTPGGRS